MSRVLRLLRYSIVGRRTDVCMSVRLSVCLARRRDWRVQLTVRLSASVYGASGIARWPATMRYMATGRRRDTTTTTMHCPLTDWPPGHNARSDCDQQIDDYYAAVLRASSKQTDNRSKVCSISTTS